MYHDPALIRKHVIKLSLSDREANLITALSEYTGEQKAAMARGLLMEMVVEMLEQHAPDSVQADTNLRGTERALSRT